MRKSIWALMGLVLLIGLAVSVAAAPPGRRRGPAAAQAQAQEQAQPQLPQAVSSAVASAFPGDGVADSEPDSEDGVSLYSVELSSGAEVLVTADGVILEVAYETEMSKVPAAAAQALQKAAAGAAIDEVLRLEIRAEIEGGKAVRLGESEILYSASFRKGGKTGEIDVAADGTIVSPLEWGTGD